MINQKKIYRGVLLKTAKLIKENTIKITFPFNTIDLGKVKSLEGRLYHPDSKSWSCPVSLENIEMLQSFEFLLDEELKKIHSKKQLIVPIDSLKEMKIPGLKGQLLPYQNKGVSFINQKEGRVLLADEMGLGKTIQVLAWLQLHPELRPVIIVVPASLKLNWQREINKWMSDNYRTEILSGSTPHTLNTNLVDIFIINYDVLPFWIGRFERIQSKVLVTDECHYFKNNNAKRTKAVLKLGKLIPHVLALSGTPITNRPVEIFNAVNLIDSTLFPSRWGFLHKYCGAKHNGFGWDFNGATNTKELHERLINSIMIRRKKKDVLKELPDKTRSFIPIELNNDKEYKNAEKDFIQWIRENKGKIAANKASNAMALTEIETLKQLAVKGKMKQVINWINDFLESGEKLVIFAVHHFVIDMLMKEFKEIAVKIDGSVTGINRQRAVDDFQTNRNTKLFIGNIKAAGVGITLTATSKVVILELPWTPGELEQAIDRVHRIGQENKVIAYFLLALDTIEEKIAALLDKKRKILDSVLDGVDSEQESLLTELINEYK